MAFDAGTIAITAEGNIAPLKRDMLKAKNLTEQNATVMQKSMTKVSSSAKRMMIGVSAAFGIAFGAAAIAKITRNITRIGAEFEQSMATVKGVMRASGKEFEDLSAIAKRMGETTEWTASQAANALQFLGMAGFEAGEAIKALPGVLDLATAGQLDLGRAADIASNALTAFQLEAEQLTRVNDVFVATITRSNTNIEMMADSFRYAAPKAKAYGYSIEQLSAMIGALGNAGVQGSMAGTQLSFAMSQVDKAADKLGYTGERKLIPVLKEIVKSGWSTAKIMDVFGERGGRAALVLSGMIPKYEALYKANLKAEGESKKLADTMRSTVIGAYKELKSAIESVAIDIFTEKSSILAIRIREMTKAVRENKEMFVGLGESLLSLVGILGKLGNSIRKISEGFYGGELARQLSLGLITPKQLMEIRKSGQDILEVLDKNREALSKGREAWEHELRKLGPSGMRREVPTAPEMTEQRLMPGPTPGGVREQSEQAVRAAKAAAEANKLSAEAQKELLANLKREAKLLGINVESLKTIEQLQEAITKAVKERIKAQRKATAIAQGQLQGIFRRQEALLAGREKADQETLDAQAKRRDDEASHNATLVRMFRDMEDQKAGIRQEADDATLASQQQYLEKVKEQAEKVKQEEEKKKQYIETTNNLIAEGATNAFMAMIDGSKSAAEAFKQMAKSILADLTRMIIKQMIFNALQKVTGSLFGLGGGGITPGPAPAIEKFGFRAEGQHGLGFTNSIVKKPTAFPMGLMGESGPEAIMPLKNIGGKLGVEASMPSSAGREVHVHFDMIKIESTDAGSFMELTTRNPEAILVPVKEAIIDGDKGLISLIAEAVK